MHILEIYPNSDSWPPIQITFPNSQTAHQYAQTYSKQHNIPFDIHHFIIFPLIPKSSKNVNN